MISLKGLTSGLGSTPQAPKNAAANQPQGNIFGQSLNVGQVKKSEKEAYIQSKNKKKAYLNLLISAVALGTYSVLFFYGTLTAYLEAPKEITKFNNENQQLAQEVLPALEETKNLHKSAYDEEFDSVIQALDTVFPTEVDKLGIVSLFESFASEVDAAFPPFEFTSITLSAPMQEGDYVVTPISTSIHSSLAGFDRFLSLVDRSGYIFTGQGDSRKLLDKKVRLMSISNISVKYRGINVQTGKDDGVDFSVKLNVYSRIGS